MFNALNKSLFFRESTKEKSLSQNGKVSLVPFQHAKQNTNPPSDPKGTIRLADKSSEGSGVGSCEGGEWENGKEGKWE